MYTGRRIKDGSLVAGYAAIGSEGHTAWIMAPTAMSDDQFRMFNVDPESLERIDRGEDVGVDMPAWNAGGNDGTEMRGRKMERKTENDSCCSCENTSETR